MSIVWWLLPIALVALWIPQNYLHELSHAAILWWYNRKVKIIPFPHKSADGKWKMAACYSETPDGAPTMPDNARAQMYKAPWITNTLFVVAIACTVTAVFNPIVRTVLLALMLTNLVDMFFNRWSLIVRKRKDSDDYRMYTNDWWRATMLESTPLWRARLDAVIWTVSPALLGILSMFMH